MVRQRGYVKLLVIGFVVGLPAAALALGFVALVHSATLWVWTDLPHAIGRSSPPTWLVLAVPVLAGGLAVLLGRLPGRGGHVPADGLSIKVTPLKDLGSVLGVAFVSLVGGAVLGPEAPVLALGGAIGGLVLVSRATQDADRVRLILTVAGVSGAMSALFGNPLAAAVFVLEALPVAGGEAIAVMLPSLAAAAGGWVLFTGLGAWGGIAAPTLSLGQLPAAGTPRLVDYLAVVLVAAVASGGAAVVRRYASRLSQLTRSFPALPLGLAAGLVVGTSAWAYGAITGDDPQWVLFSGQSHLPALVTSGTALGVGALVTLLAAKGLAYAACMGSPFRGGPIFPALFLGGALGTLVAALVPSLSPLPLFAAGMTAAAAAIMRLPLSAAVLTTVLFGAAAVPNLSSILLAAVVGVVVAGRLAGPGRAEHENALTAAAPVPG